VFFDKLGNGGANFRADTVARHRGKSLQVDSVQKFPVKCEFQLLVFRRDILVAEKPIHPPNLTVFSRSRY
jgi:hypothetical protein